MKITVLGSGVVGVTSAWYLAQAGHEVTVVDRQPGAGMETSFANAGQVSPGYSSPWAGPGVPMKSVKWLMMKYRPFVFWPMPDRHLWSWLMQMLANCTSEAYSVNKGRMVRLAEYSRDIQDDLRATTGITFDDRQMGTLQVFRTSKQLDAAAGDIEVLKQYNVPYEVLDRAGCVAIEPGLKESAHKIIGGLRLPGDQTGDAFLFTQRLAAMAAEAGVTFLHNTTIKQLKTEAGKVTGVVTDKGTLTADAYVLALGSFSPAIGRQAGLNLPIYPVKGYSLTSGIVDESRAPISTIMDETYKIAITRLGDRIRIGGTAELAGFSTSLRQPRRETLEHSVTDLFPGGGDMASATFWTGLRPMTPDGTPIIGRTSVSNLFLNTGHGTLGWTMACGSGRVLADIISGKKTDILHEDLGISRYN
ncbi:MAG: D-amino acid dehydrogenase [Acetobacter sp.]|jgi:D-amino-acid dehydrogenase|nr:D-amino acid dehydrogenase [Acetobacter sp.]MCH4061712.1 D-amino acid dehydrogenase [Acetobacter sp.]MCH4089439.1 D-amino acid dehydrogenase [Acetobacter sp.]MCI1293811.1 D-amino acid dehydrogenase [Acetobacter sp.]MCI1320395.1 D-amino acid dehydrogenase [Acetobacter sp.]